MAETLHWGACHGFCHHVHHDSKVWEQLTIEVELLVVGDEELAAVRVGPAVGHGHHAPLAMLQAVHHLIIELAVGSRVDALAAPACPCTATQGLNTDWALTDLCTPTSQSSFRPFMAISCIAE